LAKLNPDWLFRAMPMAIWLPERTHIPILGYFFQFKETAYIFSYFGAFYDLTIWLFLLNRKTRPLAYVAVVVFHVLTKVLFNIGLFPMIMMTSTLIFFSGEWHRKVHLWIIRVLKKLKIFRHAEFISASPKHQSTQLQKEQSQNPNAYAKEMLKQVQHDGKSLSFEARKGKIFKYALLTYISIQLLLPFRYLLYPNYLFWSEEGYRFSWRVMLVEKHGLATFTVADSETQRKSEIVNGDYLTLFQEKQMAIQPDFILQFAHFLAKEYEEKHGFVNPIVTVDAHVAMNGRISQQFIKSDVNLAEIKDGFLPKKWVINYK
jgi:hypothetical protein